MNFSCLASYTCRDSIADYGGVVGLCIWWGRRRRSRWLPWSRKKEWQDEASLSDVMAYWRHPRYARMSLSMNMRQTFALHGKVSALHWNRKRKEKKRNCSVFWKKKLTSLMEQSANCVQYFNVITYRDVRLRKSILEINITRTWGKVIFFYLKDISTLHNTAMVADLHEDIHYSQNRCYMEHIVHQNNLSC